MIRTLSEWHLEGHEYHYSYSPKLSHLMSRNSTDIVLNQLDMCPHGSILYNTYALINTDRGYLAGKLPVLDHIMTLFLVYSWLLCNIGKSLKRLWQCIYKINQISHLRHPLLGTTWWTRKSEHMIFCLHQSEPIIVRSNFQKVWIVINAHKKQYLYFRVIHIIHKCW